MSVGLVVREYRMVAEGPDKREEGFPCFKEMPGAKEKRLTVAYEVEASGATGPGKPRVRLATPVPPEVTEILERY